LANIGADDFGGEDADVDDAITNIKLQLVKEQHILIGYVRQLRAFAAQYVGLPEETKEDPITMEDASNIKNRTLFIVI